MFWVCVFRRKRRLNPNLNFFFFLFKRRRKVWNTVFLLVIFDKRWNNFCTSAFFCRRVLDFVFLTLVNLSCFCSELWGQKNIPNPPKKSWEQTDNPHPRERKEIKFKRRRGQWKKPKIYFYVYEILFSYNEYRGIIFGIWKKWNLNGFPLSWNGIQRTTQE